MINCTTRLLHSFTGTVSKPVPALSTVDLYMDQTDNFQVIVVHLFIVWQIFFVRSPEISPQSPEQAKRKGAVIASNGRATPQPQHAAEESDCLQKLWSTLRIRSNTYSRRRTRTPTIFCLWTQYLLNLNMIRIVTFRPSSISPAC